jgi:hypothetical protein
MHGTIFGGSHVPLHKWLQAIYLTHGGTGINIAGIIEAHRR